MQTATINLAPYDNSLWLLEPHALARIAAKVASFRACYSAREIAEARREALADARRAPSRAILSAGTMGTEEVRILAAEGKSKAIRAVRGKVGLIGVHGPIAQRMTSELMKADGTSTEAVGVALDALLADSTVGAIVLHVDSPGGTIYGVEELSDKIFAARSRKPIYCMADSMMGSAAYWIGTAAETVCATPGADVGSVGVYAMHVDQSAALEKEGFKITTAKAGKYKAEFSPYGPLSEEAAAHMQEAVDYTYAKFIDGCKRNRGTTASNVRENYGQGRVLNADKALAAGMIDRVMTFEELMGKLTGGASGAGGSSRAACDVEVLRLRHAHAKARMTT